MCRRLHRSAPSRPLGWSLAIAVEITHRVVAVVGSVGSEQRDVRNVADLVGLGFSDAGLPRRFRISGWRTRAGSCGLVIACGAKSGGAGSAAARADGGDAVVVEAIDASSRTYCCSRAARELGSAAKRWAYWSRLYSSKGQDRRASGSDSRCRSRSRCRPRRRRTAWRQTR